MTKYLVRGCWTVIKKVRITVEADSKDDAENKAIAVFDKEYRPEDLEIIEIRVKDEKKS